MLESRRSWVPGAHGQEYVHELRWGVVEKLGGETVLLSDELSTVRFREMTNPYIDVILGRVDASEFLAGSIAAETVWYDTRIRTGVPTSSDPGIVIDGEPLQGVQRINRVETIVTNQPPKPPTAFSDVLKRLRARAPSWAPNTPMIPGPLPLPAQE